MPQRADVNSANATGESERGRAVAQLQFRAESRQSLADGSVLYFEAHRLTCAGDADFCKC